MLHWNNLKKRTGDECGNLVSFPNTMMAGGTKTRSRARLAPEECPGHNLSLTEALQVVNAKLSQADDARFVRVAHLLSKFA